MQRDFKRSKIEFRIIRKESDDNAKYDLFQRLNSGTQLSPQEARNCLLVMLNLPMYEHISALAKVASFNDSVPLSEAKEEQAYRQELVLRFFAQAEFSGDKTELRQELSEFLTNWTRRAAITFGETGKDLVNSDLFHRVFSTLDAALGEDCFRRYNGKRHLGPFSIASYEFFTAGVAANIERWEGRPAELVERIHQAWSEPGFRDNSGNGVSPRRRLPRLVNEARQFFAS